MKTAAILSLTLALLGASAGGARAAELVLNGGFEDGTYTDAGGNTIVPVDWTPAPSFDYGGGDFNGVVMDYAHSGAYALEFGNYDAQPASSISQSFADVAGASYSGSLYVFASSNGDGNANFAAQIDGVSLVSVGDTVNFYTEETFNFIGTGDDTLTLNASTNPGEWYVDDVSIMGPAAMSGAPEPSTWALMLAGIGGVGLAFRRARREPRIALGRTRAA